MPLVNEENFITPSEAAEIKGVTRAGIYSAIRAGRLRRHKVLGRLALRESEVLAWTPTPNSGRPKGIAVTDRARRSMSEAQKRRRLKEKLDSSGPHLRAGRKLRRRTKLS